MRRPLSLGPGRGWIACVCVVYFSENKCPISKSIIHPLCRDLSPVPRSRQGWMSSTELSSWAVSVSCRTCAGSHRGTSHSPSCQSGPVTISGRPSVARRAEQRPGACHSQSQYEKVEAKPYSESKTIWKTVGYFHITPSQQVRGTWGGIGSESFWSSVLSLSQAVIWRTCDDHTPLIPTLVLFHPTVQVRAQALLEVLSLVSDAS